MRYKVKKLSQIILLYMCCFIGIKFFYLHYNTKVDPKHLEAINTFQEHPFNSSKDKSMLLESFYNSENHSKEVNNAKILRRTELADIFISVKTTKKFHEDRVALLLDTWWIFARSQTYFFTDDDDPEFSKRTKGHMVNTNCTDSHSRNALCCKMSAEFDHYITSEKRWFCHVDDDTYVNIPALVNLLQQYNSSQEWYLGKPSLNHPIEIPHYEHSNGPKISFWFATGGAGFCISRPLAIKMIPHVGGGRLKSQCTKIRLPDDCSIGFAIEYLLKRKLTVIPEFHSHLEGLWLLKYADLHKQITMSYKTSEGKNNNIVEVEGYSISEDPTRLRSIHCKLNPYLEECTDWAMSMKANQTAVH